MMIYEIKSMRKPASFLLVLLLTSCAEKMTSNQKVGVPSWAQDIVWYQIFPERFRNGDSSNDPSPKYMTNTYPEMMPENWSISKWSSDWYEEDDWMRGLDMSFNDKLQLRRYGGDLQGVLDKIDYLDSLGITGVYFNPLNDAPSLHKYDPRHWRHIDVNFGPDPDGDRNLIDSEIPIDPSTWNWTSADKLFLKVIEELHKRKIRVIMDFSWNHTGYDFWAVNDIRKHREKSEFKDWYEVEKFDDPSTDEDETKISGWWGFKYLPLIKENVDNEEDRLPHGGNVSSESFKQHVFNVSKRWLDPNGDGDFSDGVDGFRLDVATEMTLGWWDEYTKFVKSVNQEALLIAEAWWFNWPDLSGPERMITDGHFDALMNYRWFVLSSGMFKQSNPSLKPSEFVDWYDSLIKDIPIENQRAMMNIVATHDTPRLSTSFFNENRFDQGTKLSDNHDYKVHRPDSETWLLVKAYLLFQYSFIGSPHIWNGDELGMWGANDPDDRKPIWWDDIEFESEETHPFKQRVVPQDSVRSDPKLLTYYKDVIRMRTENAVLSFGELKYIVQDDEQMLLGYSRISEGKEAFAVFNLGDEVQTFETNASYNAYFNGIDRGMRKEVVGGKLKLNLPPRRGQVWISE